MKKLSDLSLQELILLHENCHDENQKKISEEFYSRYGVKLPYTSKTESTMVSIVIGASIGILLGTCIMLIVFLKKADYILEIITP